MAKVAKKEDNAQDGERAKKEWSEGELIEKFKLKRIGTELTPAMVEWLDVTPPVLNIHEQYVFDKALMKAKKYISGWQEEDLKMKFIGKILELGLLEDNDYVMSYFDKIISGMVENTKLTVKSDYMLAKGTLDYFQTPYFHFQEYKPYKNPSGDSMAQLLEAFLIAQVENEKEGSENPLYGCEIIGATWRFITMEEKSYCVSKSFDCSDDEDLLKIIAILRKFKMILETRLLS